MNTKASLRAADPIRADYESFMLTSESADASIDIEQGKRLLTTIRERGRDIADEDERDAYAQMARSLGERLYLLTGDYLPVRLEAPSAEALQTQESSLAAGVAANFAYALPAPAPPVVNGLRETDPELYNLWLHTVEKRFEDSEKTFGSLLSRLWQPFHMTMRLSQILLIAGAASLLTAIGAAFWVSNIYLVIIFVAVAALCYLAYTTSHLASSVEERLMFVTRIGLIYNTYWFRLLNIQPAQSPTTGIEIQSIMNDALLALYGANVSTRIHEHSTDFSNEQIEKQMADARAQLEEVRSNLATETNPARIAEFQSMEKQTTDLLDLLERVRTIEESKRNP